MNADGAQMNTDASGLHALSKRATGGALVDANTLGWRSIAAPAGAPTE